MSNNSHQQPSNSSSQQQQQPQSGYPPNMWYQYPNQQQPSNAPYYGYPYYPFPPQTPSPQSSYPQQHQQQQQQQYPMYSYPPQQQHQPPPPQQPQQPPQQPPHPSFPMHTYPPPLQPQSQHPPQQPPPPSFPPPSHQPQHQMHQPPPPPPSVSTQPPQPQRSPQQNFPQSQPQYSLSSPATVSTKQSPQETRKKQNDMPSSASSALPASLQRYIHKSFQVCTTQEQMKEMEDILTTMITKSKENKTYAKINWDQKEIPKLNSITNSSSTLTEQSHPEKPLENKRERKQKKKKGKRKRSKDKEKQEPPAKKTKIQSNAKTDSDTSEELKMRQKRFSQKSKGPQAKPVKQTTIKSTSNGDVELENITIQGTSNELEKQYFRLTSTPDPSTVRPEYVLKQSLDHVLEKYRNNDEYRNVWEQFKSIRQDLTVQHIQNEFTVKVYENNARIALENEDWGEFIQCLSQLRVLYRRGIDGNPSEFTAYNILYLGLGGSKTDLTNAIQDISQSLLKTWAVQHALTVCTAMSLQNYLRIVNYLFQKAPNRNGLLIRPFLKKLRLKGLLALTKSSGKHIPLSSITQLLGFRSENESKQFIKEQKILISSSGKIDSRKSMNIIISNLGGDPFS